MAAPIDIGATTATDPTQAREGAPEAVAGPALWLRRFAERGSRFVWLVVLPVLLASLWMRYLVPTPAEAEGTWAEPLARIGNEHTVVLWSALMLVFGGLWGYWSAWLPGSRTAMRKGDLLGIIVVVGLSAAAALLLRGSFGSFRVLSASMLPTLEPEDIVLGRQLSASFSGSAEPSVPARGDIVVFQKPAGLEGPDELVKRVIGLPGDRITMNGAHPVINGWEVPSCDAGSYLYPLPDGGGVVGRLYVEFLDGRAFLAIHAIIGPEWKGPYDVKAGEVFVLGDNRNNSSDSRAWNKGKAAGLAVSAIDARIDHWLFGFRRNDRVDLGHLFHPLELSPRLDGMDSSTQREGIAHCLAQRPTDTHPPAPQASPPP